MNNVQLCKTITEKHVQHFVHLIELHGRKVLYIKFLQTIVKAENQYIKNCQDVVMAEVCGSLPKMKVNQLDCFSLSYSWLARMKF